MNWSLANTNRSLSSPVKRLSDLHGKPDIVRVVSELGLVLISYPR